MRKEREILLPGKNSSLEPPFGKLIDSQGRKITYIRLAITDRCNLRCIYCMPEKGVVPLGHKQILSLEEMIRLVKLFMKMGVTKVRITGGEPFVRKGCIDLLHRLKTECGVPELFITTNGVELLPYLEELKKIGISGINMSLDTLDREKFHRITRRDRLGKVLEAFDEILRLGINLKINSVVSPESSDEDIIHLADLAYQYPISLRFIEQMKFSGDKHFSKKDTEPLENRLFTLFSDISPVESTIIETARRYKVAGAKGSLGIIEGESRKFCSTCNKVRITPRGTLKTCLYDDGSLNLLPLLRKGISDLDLAALITDAVKKRYANGYLAEKANTKFAGESMAKIGG